MLLALPAELFLGQAALVAAALVEPKRRRKTKPSRGAHERRLSEKKLRGKRKEHRRAGADD